MDEQTQLLTEILSLLRLIAEPQIAKRDEAQRTALVNVVGNSSSKANAVVLMDGTRTQAQIRQEAKIDQGGLSRLTKALREVGLIANGEKPKLLITIPSDFAAKGHPNG